MVQYLSLNDIASWELRIGNLPVYVRCRRGTRDCGVHQRSWCEGTQPGEYSRRDLPVMKIVEIAEAKGTLAEYTSNLMQ